LVLGKGVGKKRKRGAGVEGVKLTTGEKKKETEDLQITECAIHEDDDTWGVSAIEGSSMQVNTREFCEAVKGILFCFVCSSCSCSCSCPFTLLFSSLSFFVSVDSLVPLPSLSLLHKSQKRKTQVARNK